MKKKTLNHSPSDGYEDAPRDIAAALESGRRVMGLIPPPDRLVLRKVKKVKVTMDLPERDVVFFKKHARKLGVSYQAMIKSVLDHYVQLNSSGE